MSMSTETEQTWVASGPAGTVGSIHRVGGSFHVRLWGDDLVRGPFDRLDVAQRALHAALGPGADRPEFREH